MSGFDDAGLRAGMQALLDLSDRLDEAARVGADARTLLDLAEAKAVAGMAVRKRLIELGWTAPVPVRVTS